MDLIAWVGSLLLAMCAIPQALHSWRTRSSASLSWCFLIMWSGGEFLLLVYTLVGEQWALVANYTCNLLCLAIILRFKV